MAPGRPYVRNAVSGPFFGDEIRPALPVATSDPVVYPWQLPDSAGNEVIEITIDERGEIVRKTVLQSLGPDIDSQVPGSAGELALPSGHAQRRAHRFQAGCHLPVPRQRLVNRKLCRSPERVRWSTIQPL